MVVLNKLFQMEVIDNEGFVKICILSNYKKLCKLWEDMVIPYDWPPPLRDGKSL